MAEPSIVSAFAVAALSIISEKMDAIISFITNSSDNEIALWSQMRSSASNSP